MLNRRNYIVLAVFIIALFGISIRLLFITTTEKKTYESYSQNLTTKKIYSAGTRGCIYDRNGVLLAGNRSSFSIYFDHTDLDNDEMTESLLEITKIIKANDAKIIQSFPIKKKGKKYYYSYDKELSDYLKKEKFDEDITAAEVFENLKTKFSIAKETDAYTAQKEMINEHSYTPPISIPDMTFSYENEKKNFLERFSLDEKTTAEDAYFEILKIYNIDKNVSYKDASSVLAIRNSIRENIYNSYYPTKIASDVSIKLVSIIEEMSVLYPSFSTVLESKRYYPKKNLLSHVLGYMGPIPESDLEEYQENGYMSGDFIGLSGVEQEFEDILRGQVGVKTIQVNSAGEKTADIGKEVKAVKGKDIYLTIDSRLQKTSEDALEEIIRSQQTGTAYRGKYTTKKFSKYGTNARTAAVVAIKVKTGEPVAIASYPDYDPNLFADGISTKNWNKLQPKNERDYLDGRPLYNVALKTAVQPGSTFKPITAIAALKKGLDPYRQIVDRGFVEIGNTKHECLIYSEYHSTHGAQNLWTGMQNSCNYYFYSIGKGKDWGTGESLGYSMTVDDMTKVAKSFGLGTSTGIELPETTSAGATKEGKIESTKGLLKNYLLSNAYFFFDKSIQKSESKLLKSINTICSWVKEDPESSVIKKRIEKLGVKKSQSEEVAWQIKATYFDYSKWTDSDIVNVSIGQGENAYTPMQMATYIAALGNDGKRMDTSLLYKVQGESKKKRKVKKDTKTSSAITEDVISAMRRVVTGGTLANYLLGTKYPTAGKTGTAENNSYINSKSEVSYVKKHLSSINSKLKWKNVKKEMKRLMKTYPKIYTSEDTAVRVAVKNLSGKNFNMERIDKYKEKYEPFGWVVALSGTDDPEIAVAALVVEAKTSGPPAPVVRDVIDEYFVLKEKDKKKDK